MPPPDAEPDEHGEIEFTLAEAHRLEAAGAGRYPNEQAAALIGSTLLFGESVDELLDLLRPGADDKVREEVHFGLNHRGGAARNGSVVNPPVPGGDAT